MSAMDDYFLACPGTSIARSALLSWWLTHGPHMKTNGLGHWTVPRSPVITPTFPASCKPDETGYVYCGSVAGGSGYRGRLSEARPSVILPALSMNKLCVYYTLWILGIWFSVSGHVTL